MSSLRTWTCAVARRAVHSGSSHLIFLRLHSEHDCIVLFWLFTPFWPAVSAVTGLPVAPCAPPVLPP